MGKSGGKSSVRMVVSTTETAAKSGAPVRTHVTLQPWQGGRLGQSVSHAPSDDTSDTSVDVRDLLDMPDDNDEDAWVDRADSLENEFFGPIGQSVPVEKKDPVRTFSLGLSPFVFKG